jgi:UDPglucose 6-dehydrogenase
MLHGKQTDWFIMLIIFFVQVIIMNESQKRRFTTKVVKELFNTIRGKKITVLGFAFKKDTGDTRCSASITLIKQFREEGAQISIYDPKVKENQYWLDLVNPQVPGDDQAGKTTLFCCCC